MEKLDMWLGARIALLRLRAGLSQSQLAEALGRPPSEIMDYERGAREIDAVTAWTISQVLQLPVDHLFQFAVERQGLH